MNRREVTTIGQTDISHNIATILLAIIMILTTISIIPPAVGTGREISNNDNEGRRNGEKEWTVFVYMAADNNLEDVSVSDFNEMEMVGSGQNLNIVVQWDRIPGHDSTNGNWNDTRRFLVQKDMDPNVVATTPVNDSMGEMDMTDPDTLEEFLEWGLDSYPAKRYILVMWDHGSGLFRRSGEDDDPTRGFCQDWTDGGDLKIWELANVLDGLRETRGTHFEIIAADVCYFGFIEMAYQLREHTNFFIGSSDEEPAAGWNYEKALSYVSEKPLSTSMDVAINIVDRYLESYTQSYITQMALDIAAMEVYLIPSLSTFSRTLISTTYYYQSEIKNARRKADSPRSGYVDLYSFVSLIKDDNTLPLVLTEKATELIAAIETSIPAFGTGTNHPDSMGLGIWFPENFLTSSNKNTYVRKLDFANTPWDDFLKEYDKPTAISIEHTPLDDTEDVGGPYIFEATINAPEGSIEKVLLNYSMNGGNFTSRELVLTNENYRLELDVPLNNTIFCYYIILALVDDSIHTSPVNADPAIPGTCYSFWVGLDVTPPTIIHFPMEYIMETDSPHLMTVTISDNMGVDENSTFLKYCVNGTPPEANVTAVLMDRITHSIFQAEVPPQTCSTNIFYWIETKDVSKSGNTGRLPLTGYFHSTYVREEKRLLVDRAHGNDMNYMNITQEYLVENFEVEFLTSEVTRDRITDFDLFITTGPTIAFTHDELGFLDEFCRDDGRSILVIGEGNVSVTSPVIALGGMRWINSTDASAGNTTDVNISLEKFNYVDTIYYNQHSHVLEGGNYEVLNSNSDEKLCVFSNIERGRFGVIVDGMLSDGNITRVEDYALIDNFEFARGLLRLLIDNREPVAVINVEEALETEDVLEVDALYTFTGLDSYDLDGEIMNYTWQLNGISIGYGEKITHVFNESGELDLNLHVKDVEETWSHGSKRYVVNVPPIPKFTAALNATKMLEYDPGGIDIIGGESIQFTDASIDIDGIITRRRWEFSDGTGTLVNKTEFVHSFNKMGRNTVSLSVWDNNGVSRTFSMIFNASNAPPVVVVEVAKRGNEDDEIFISAHNSYDPNDSSDMFFTSLLWDFGDGHTQNYSLDVSHTYRKAGTYNITLYITDLDPNDPLTGSDTASIKIHNLPPKASANYTEKNGARITFSGLNSTDTASDYDSLRYHWDFGDGKTGEGLEIKHHFKKDGNFTVVLTVTDDDGANDTAVLQVTITSSENIVINYPAVGLLIGLLILLIIVWKRPKNRSAFWVVAILLPILFLGSIFNLNTFSKDKIWYIVMFIGLFIVLMYMWMRPGSSESDEKEKMTAVKKRTVRKIKKRKTATAGAGSGEGEKGMETEEGEKGPKDATEKGDNISADTPAEKEPQSPEDTARSPSGNGGP